MRRRSRALMLGALCLIPVAWWLYGWLSFPSDQTPEGAYYRVIHAVNRGHPEEFFAYTETAAQHACWSLLKYRRAARQRVLQAYPEPQRSRLAQQYAELAGAEHGAGVFALLAQRYGWVGRLRRDLSGIQRVERHGERASVITVAGTRYPFRRQKNGIWGLTLFSAELRREAEKAARDQQLIQQAAAAYERARGGTQAAPRPAVSSSSP